MANPEVTIPELGAFVRGLKKIDKGLGRKMGQINKRTGEKVAVSARSRYSERYAVRAGRVPKSIRSTATQRAVKVILGRESVPYALGQEFGSNRYPQFAPWTGSGPGGKGSRGRFFYPAIREETKGIVGDYLKELDEVAREAFPRG